MMVSYIHRYPNIKVGEQNLLSSALWQYQRFWENQLVFLFLLFFLLLGLLWTFLPLLSPLILVSPELCLWFRALSGGMVFTASPLSFLLTYPTA